MFLNTWKNFHELLFILVRNNNVTLKKRSYATEGSPEGLSLWAQTFGDSSLRSE
jgi:hypothetical protein